MIKPEVVHGLWAETEVRTLDVKFYVRASGLQRDLAEAPESMVWRQKTMQRLFNLIRSEGEQRLPHFRSMCALYLHQLLLCYLRQAAGEIAPLALESAEAEPPDPLVRRADEWIRVHHAAHVTVAQMARDLGYSERALRKRFREALGERPLTYLQRFRVDRAKEFIQYSDYTLKEIAARTGFQTIHHFTRVFGAQEGMSPAAWRAKFRQGIRKDVCINPRFSNPHWLVRRKG